MSVSHNYEYKDAAQTKSSTASLIAVTASTRIRGKIEVTGEVGDTVGMHCELHALCDFERISDCQTWNAAISKK